MMTNQARRDGVTVLRLIINFHPTYLEAQSFLKEILNFLLKMEQGLGTERNAKADWKERLVRGYLYWTPNSWLALSAEFQYERLFKRDFSAENEFESLRTHRVPLGIKFFHPTGLNFGLETTYVNQQGKFGEPLFGDRNIQRGEDQFWIFDGSISYRLPNRHGIISIEGKNILNKNFNFQDTDPANPEIYPESLITLRFTLSF